MNFPVIIDGDNPPLGSASLNGDVTFTFHEEA